MGDQSIVEFIRKVGSQYVVFSAPEPGFLCYRRSRDKEHVHGSKLWEIYKLKGQKLHEAGTGELAGRHVGPVSFGGSGRLALQEGRSVEQAGQEEVEEVRKFRQKRSKARVYNQSPTYWTIGQLGIPYGATAMGDQTLIEYVRKVGSQHVDSADESSVPLPFRTKWVSDFGWESGKS